MRIRQVKPSFWSDVTTAAMVHLDDTALFYIGLWMEADDAGYLRWEPRQIAAELYPYQSVLDREAAVLQHKVALESVGKLRVLKCGHAVIPSLPAHQRLSGETKRVYTIRDEHARHSPRKPAGSRGSPPGRVGLGRVGNGKNARAHEEPSNGMATIEEHDAQRSQPLSEEEAAKQWMTLWHRSPSGRSRQRAEGELTRLGYRLEGKEWVR